MVCESACENRVAIVQAVTIVTAWIWYNRVDVDIMLDPRCSAALGVAVLMPKFCYESMTPRSE